MELGILTGDVDGLPGSQDPANSHMHSMCSPGEAAASCASRTKKYVDEQLKQCTLPALAKALHAIQDSFPRGHRGGRQWKGMPREKDGEDLLDSAVHLLNDLLPSTGKAAAATKATILEYCQSCGQCKK
jgi:hypothetical protein